MSTLLQLQEQFQQFLLSGQMGIHNAINHSKTVSVDTRLGIYRDAYVLRLTESLSNNFPSLAIYLGTDAFHNLSHAYISQYPSSYRSIRWFGDSLPAFIADYYPQDPHLAELAEFEWHMSLAFDAADASVLTVEEMAAVSPELWGNLQFNLHPSVQRKTYSWNIVPLWQALTGDRELPKLHYNQKGNDWIIYRDSAYLIHFQSLSQEESWALEMMSQKSSFAMICEGLCRWVEAEEVGMRVAGYLKGWIQKGILSEMLIVD